PGTALPSVKLCTPATLPNAAFVVGKVSKSIYRRFSDDLAEGGDLSAMEKRDCSKIRDQLAMEAYSYIKGMERPNEIEMNFALETFRETPSELYYPDSLKATIDLEFELMVRNKIYMRKCENCGRFFTALDDNTRCDRVNSSGKTCRRQYEELVESITVEARGNMPKPGENPSGENAETANITEISPVSSVVIPPPEIREPVIVPKETEKRAQKLYNALYKRVNKGIDENEFKEWSQYLSNMKRNLKIGEATLKQYEEFLDYSDRLAKEVKLASKNKTVHAPVEKPFDMRNSGDASGNAGSGSEMSAEITEENGISEDEFVEIAQLSEKIEKNSARNIVSESPKVPQVEGTLVSSDNIKVKPFTPQAFDSVFDAMQAGNGGEDGESPKKKEKPVEIKKPKWERISREDAFKDKDEE
ncbi:MAG: hypothetical protein K2K34_04960, partial [Oscillospiraceae bacterium]|nr:hypothetical protein [Oscillospiraceae bacterium]